MAPETWYDSVFGHLHHLNRYAVEGMALLIAAFVIHLGYGVLADRQRESSVSRISPGGSPAFVVSIGTISNSGQGSSTHIGILETK